MNSIRTAYFYVLVSAFFVGFSGCESATRQACAELPKLARETATIVADLHSHVPLGPPKSKKGRRIATVVEPGAPIEPPSASTREHWLRWAEKTLKRSQALRDGVEDEVAFRNTLDSLNTASLELVHFHGFLSQKKYGRAEETLEKFRRTLGQFESELCLGMPPR